MDKAKLFTLMFRYLTLGDPTQKMGQKSILTQQPI